jgi:hypothetical protein
MKTPTPETSHHLSFARRTVALSAFAGLATLVVGCLIVEALCWVRYGSSRAGPALLQGQALLVEPAHFSLGLVAPLEPISLTCRAINLTGHEIAVHGFGAYCCPDGCVNADDAYPLTVAAGASRTLTLRVRAPGERNRSFQLDPELYTGVGNHTILITGKTGQKVATRLGALQDSAD